MNKVKAPSHRLSSICPVAVVMIALNEGHNMDSVLQNLKGWAQEIFLVDSYSTDETVDIALDHGVHVVQRAFHGFGDQWNFALSELPITAAWTMKLDPDERLTDELKGEIELAISADDCDALSVDRKLWFMGQPLSVSHSLVRVWRTGHCRFTDVLVNEHPVVDGRIKHVFGVMEHHDSPNLDHWFEKQNRYTTVEAISRFQRRKFADRPLLLGTKLQRRMWYKKYFFKVPGRYLIAFIDFYLLQGSYRAGAVGYRWARLRCMARRMIEYKIYEINKTGKIPGKCNQQVGGKDLRVRQY